ncbi:MAG: DUF1588 domain-containing protein, partial [Verrucomicrobiota bacterium]
WLGLDDIDGARKGEVEETTLKAQAVDFVDYLFTENRPLMELIDSRTAFANYVTAKYYPGDAKQMVRYQKPKGVERAFVSSQRITLEQPGGRYGGILTTPGVLKMNRGPILRGTWMVEKILGQHLGEPPPDVPPIQSSFGGKKLSFREQFERHRADQTCARCHDKIDPLGFAMASWKDDGFPAKGEMDTAGQLPSGETFADFAELQQLLLTSQREPIVRNMVERTLTYALARKLEYFDQSTVDELTEQMLATDGTWRDLFVAVAQSLPFQEVRFPES